MYSLYYGTVQSNYVIELLKSFYPNGKIDNRKKKLIADQWSSYIMEFFFPTKLNEWHLKSKPRRPFFFLHWVEHGRRFVEKNQYDNTKGCPKFGMATYTKEIVVLKKRETASVIWLTSKLDLYTLEHHLDLFLEG